MVESRAISSFSAARTGRTTYHTPRPPIVILGPAVLVAAAVLLPVTYLSIRTFGASAEVWDLLFRARTLDIIGRSALLVAAVSSASIVIAVPLAWLTVRTDLPLRRIWTVLTALPLVMPSYVAGFVIVIVLGPHGMLQQVLSGPFGVEQMPDIYGFPGAMLTLTLLSYPYVLLPVRAAMRHLDPSLEESSLGLGHGSWTTFRRVTLPLLRPSIAAGALLVALYTLSDFGAVSLLRYETFTWAIYLQYQSAFDRTIASALSLVLVILAGGILILEARTRGRSQHYSSTTTIARPPPLIKLGRWRWPSFAFCATIVLLALLMPMSVLIYWVARGVSAGEPLMLLWSAAWNSIYISGLSAGAALAASLPLAILTVRYPGRFSGLLDRIAHVGFALPGIVVALALVFFGITFVTPLYQTLGLLIFAYMILFLPAAIGPIRASLFQVSPRIEEAARSLGSAPSRVLATITFPLVRSGVLAGTALVFLLTMKELPATLILGPIGLTTLATSIWSAASEAFFARAAAPALLLIVVSSIPLALLLERQKKWQS